MRTAGRSVLVAGITVVIGMLGLLVLRQALLNGVAVAATGDWPLPAGCCRTSAVRS